MPKEIRALAGEVLSNPHVVELTRSTPADTIDHALYPVSEDGKHALLEALLARAECDSAIVFTRTKHRAKRLAFRLQQAGHRAVGLQGNMSQGARERAMNGFRSRLYDVLVATDIAARGIDVHGVSHVINFDVPNTPEAYTHRIGRTGRAELDGVACTFVTRDDDAWVRATERMIGTSIRRRRFGELAVEEEAPAEPREGTSFGRPSRKRRSSRGPRRS
jgi:ATP-dependent RNA helicase RhlE